MLFVKGYSRNLYGAEQLDPLAILQNAAHAPLPNVRIRNKNARALRGWVCLGDWSHALESHYPGLDATLQWD